MRTSPNLPLSAHWCVPTLAALVLVACSGATGSALPELDQAKAALSAAAPPPPPPGVPANHAVPRCALDSLHAQFDTRFCQNLTTGCVPLTNSLFDVPLQEVINMVNTTTVDTPNLRGLWMQYGLDGSGNFVTGFRVPLLHPSGPGAFTVDTTGTTFFTRNSADQLRPSSYTAWANGQLATYLSKVMVRRRPGASPSPLNPAELKDRTSYLMPWETVLQAMVASNSDSVTAATRLVVACIAENRMTSTDPPSNDIRHHLVVCLRNGSNLLVDGRVYVNAPFRLKGCDLASPCPTSCLPFAYSSQAMPACH